MCPRMWRSVLDWRPRWPSCRRSRGWRWYCAATRTCPRGRWRRRSGARWARPGPTPHAGGWWYQQIAAYGYDPQLVPIPGATGPITLEGNSAAFFPLYPALMRLVSELTDLGLYGAGLLVSVVAGTASCVRRPR